MHAARSLLTSILFGIAIASSAPLAAQSVTSSAFPPCGAIVTMNSVCAIAIAPDRLAAPSRIGHRATDSVLAQPRRHTLRGAVVGLVAGASLGSIVAGTSKMPAACLPDECPCGPRRVANTACGAAFHGMLGGALGGIIGHFVQTK